MRRPAFIRIYSSDATEKADEATPINRCVRRRRVEGQPGQVPSGVDIRVERSQDDSLREWAGREDGVWPP